MNHSARWRAAAALALAAALWALPAAASCTGDARKDFRACRAGCKEQFQTARDGCLNRDHTCVEGCRALRADCTDATGIEAALEACNDTLAAARRTCRQNHEDGPDRDQCIDQAQLVAFQCRDQARETAQDALLQCRKAFRACTKGCPAVPPAAAGTRQCKRDANRAFKECNVACREDFQVAKDACRNLNHDCVEACRAGRHDCLDPVLDALDAAVAACKATRDTAVQTCKDLYAEGTAERDQCIDNAQAAAFQCRDQAKEDARPGVEACRAGFEGCIEACPPASPSGAFLD